MKLHPKYKPLFNDSSRYYLITGGRGSGKSFGVSTAILLASFEKGNNILYSRYTMTSASTSIIPEMVEKIELLGLEGHFTVNSREIINNSTGNTIYFRGLKVGSGNQTAALKSLSNIATFVLDEAEECPDEALFDKIDLSVRSQDALNRVIMVMNPATKAHWIYSRFFERRGLIGGENTRLDDTTYIHTTYKDNIDNLPDSFLKSMDKMSISRPEEYKHVVLGGWRETAEGVIFTNWTRDNFNWNGDYIGVGMDFGFSNDPTAACLINIDKKARKIYIKELFYKASMTTSDIAEVIHRKVKGASQMTIIGDSAEGRLLHELKHSHNLNKVKPSIKGVGSINLGIALMQDYELVIDPTSINLIKELNNYVWDGDKEKPIDDFNHALDGIRYFVSYHLSKPNSGNYYVS
jgi:phage terminase large subunit